MKSKLTALLLLALFSQASIAARYEVDKAQAVWNDSWIEHSFTYTHNGSGYYYYNYRLSLYQLPVDKSRPEHAAAVAQRILNTVDVGLYTYNIDQNYCHITETFPEALAARCEVEVLGDFN